MVILFKCILKTFDCNLHIRLLIQLFSISSHGDIKVLLANSGTATQLSNSPVAFVSEAPTPNPRTYLGSRLRSRTVGRRSFRYGRRYGWFEIISSTKEQFLISASDQSPKGPGFGRKKTISISMWLLRYFYLFQIEMGRGSWKHSFTVYQVVSLEDVIWELCREGDISGLQKLFASGAYSPFVTDEDGWTLIHVRTLSWSQFRYNFSFGSERSIF